MDGSAKGFTYTEELDVFEHFNPAAMQTINENTFLYDLDSVIEYDEELREKVKKNLFIWPGEIEIHSYDKILHVASNNSSNIDDLRDKDVLLLYSGGKDRL